MAVTTVTIFLQMQWHGWPLKHAPSHISYCYHAQFSRSTSTSLGISLGHSRLSDPTRIDRLPAISY